MTYSMEIIMELAGVEGWTILSTGGTLRPGSLAFMGHQVADTLSRYHVDKAILSCKGIDPAAGITDSAESHALAKQAMIRNAREVILALDDTKFDKISFVQVAPLESVQTVVTSRKPDKAWLEQFKQLQVDCRYPE